MPGVSIRIADEADVRELARLRVLMDAEDGVEAEPEFEDAFADWFGAHGHSFTIVVAELDDRLIGTVWLELIERVPRPSEVDPAPVGYVTFTFVEPGHRNHGIGAAMLSFLRSTAVDRRCETVIVWPSQRSLPLYRRAGYDPPAELLEQVLRFPPP
ncbi:MAG TPA: GNAT family N-acetyltransferase [Acidimicrobiales bacterium]|nr:GNAT family N-acetyltransferase [Acidimicrobiales bacterium]